MRQEMKSWLSVVIQELMALSVQGKPMTLALCERIMFHFSFHGISLGPNNCSVLVRATVVNSKLLQPRISGMTGPVMKLNADLTEYFCLWRVTMAVVCVQSLTVHWEKLHQASSKKVPMCLKVRGCNTQHWDEKSRTWHPALDICMQGKSCASGRGSQASVLTRWPTLTKRVAEPRGVLVRQWGGTSFPLQWWCSWARRWLFLQSNEQRC